MIIGLDWDGTYTADPGLWDSFIRLAKERGHDVRIVTMRWADKEHVDGPQGIPVIYTGRKPKKPFAPDVDVWIDDCPVTVNG